MAITPEQKARKRIDKMLKRLGWGENNSHIEKEFSTSTGPCDYLLIVDGKKKAIIEAKRACEHINKGIDQAMRYADDLEVDYIYSCNGNQIIFVDLRKGAGGFASKRELLKFHTPEHLLKLDEVDLSKSKKYFQENKGIYQANLWEHQKKAIESIEEKVFLANRRKGLLVMATGTGKTVTAINLVIKALESQRFKKILFLVDRKALKQQAKQEFVDFDMGGGNKLSEYYDVDYFDGENISDAKIQIGMLQTLHRKIRSIKSKVSEEKVDDLDEQKENEMLEKEDAKKFKKEQNSKKTDKKIESEINQRKRINFFEDEITDEKFNFGPNIGEFDLVITDECHRSIYGLWREVIDYFDAVNIGLTATPHDYTNAIFERNITFTYTVEDGENDDILVPHDIYEIETGITMDGLKLPAGTIIKKIRIKKGKNGEDDIHEVFEETLAEDTHYKSNDIEKKISIEDRNIKIIRELKKLDVENKKTIVFAMNEYHAIALEELFNREFSKYCDRTQKFAQKITSGTDNYLEKIAEFKNDEFPKVAITVTLMSTGVDIKPIENVVFMKPVKSPILYTQMCGRGTRAYKNDSYKKEKFTIIDCVGVTKYFEENDLSEFKYDPTKIRTPPKGGNGGGVIEKLYDDIHEDVIKKSEYKFKTNEGKSVSSKEFIEAFKDKINKNKDKEDIIEIVLNRPRELDMKKLKEIEEYFKNNPEIPFTVDSLKKASGKEFNSIIEFIRWGLDGKENFHKSEFLNRIIYEMSNKRQLTEEHLKWLEHIKLHFENKNNLLIISESDLKEMPFRRLGGIRKARELFGNNLELLKELQENIIKDK